MTKRGVTCSGSSTPSPPQSYFNTKRPSGRTSSTFAGNTSAPLPSTRCPSRSSFVLCTAFRISRFTSRPGPRTEFTLSPGSYRFIMPCRAAKAMKSCGNDIVFLRNFRSPVRDTVTKFTCMCSRATSIDSTIVAPSNNSCKSSHGNLKHGSMWLSSDRRATITARSRSPP